MRVLRWAFPLLMLAALAAAQQKTRKTDAQQDQLNGPVRSVSTQVVSAPVKWIEPGGRILVTPVWCRDCDYDEDGNRTRAGQVQPDGKFIGEDIEYVRDGEGHVVERTRISTIDGKVFERDKFGPFGPVEETFSNGGSAVRSTMSYDRLGNLAEWLTFDANGQVASRSIARTNPDGQWTERATFGKDGHLQYRETYDPETDLQRFESYDEAGAVQVTFTFSHGKIQSFWEATDAPNQYGQDSSTDLKDGKADSFSCHKDGTCDVAHIQYTYADSAHQFPATAEWRLAAGKLLYATWCEYEFDDQHNWTKRTVWVLSPEIPERALYETDTRTIRYWAK